jgi:hypothetical protein
MPHGAIIEKSKIVSIVFLWFIPEHVNILIHELQHSEPYNGKITNFKRNWLRTIERGHHFLETMPLIFEEFML